MPHCTNHEIYVLKDTLIPSVRHLETVLMDYNGQPVTGTYEIDLILQGLEKEVNMEKTFGPGSLTLQEHPNMNQNFNIMRAN